MKSLTLDSIRRLIGRHRKKDKHESSFKRSESFKRISIKKNYLDRGGKCRNPGKFALKKGGETTSKEGAVTGEAQIIDYGEWIRCIQQEDKEPQSKKSSLQSSFNVSTDSALEATATKSPRPTKRFPLCSKESNDLDDGSKTDSAISVSLGRIWMDAPLTMTNAPRSLELPKPVSVIELNPNGQRAHHSLESALKDKKDDKFEGRIPSLNSPSVFKGSSGFYRGLSSSKDSGFSFSISIPRLSPVMSHEHGLFRKKKTCASKAPGKRLADRRRTPSTCSDYRRKTRHHRSHKGEGSAAIMYQVVVNRQSRAMDALKLDPIIFVPPEKRNKSTIKRTYQVQEIRDYCTPCDAQQLVRAAEDSDELDELYEVISEERDELETDSAGSEPECRDVDPWISQSDDDESRAHEWPAGRDPSGHQANFSPNLKRRPVARKKSVYKNIRYVAKPIHRAPSTLKRNRKPVKKNTSTFYFLIFTRYKLSRWPMGAIVRALAACGQRWKRIICPFPPFRARVCQDVEKRANPIRLTLVALQLG